MRVVVASGKGGTGKTTVATCLAVVAARDGRAVHLVDCDVEEPNAHLFLRPEITSREPATIPVPRVNDDLCNGCGECADLCEFNALACVAGGVMVFAELCHGCGGCPLVCPTEAIAMVPREIGIVEDGAADGVRFTHGRLHVGQALVPPLIRATARRGYGADLTLIDAPPGTSCNAIAAMRSGDQVLLVTEPTPFGHHDLVLAVETVRQLGLPFAVVVNRVGAGDDRIHRYCAEEDIPILAEIPDDRRIAEAYAAGEPPVARVPGLDGILARLLAALDAPRPGGAS